MSANNGISESAQIQIRCALSHTRQSYLDEWLKAQTELAANPADALWMSQRSYWATAIEQVNDAKAEFLRLVDAMERRRARRPDPALRGRRPIPLACV